MKYMIIGNPNLTRVPPDQAIELYKFAAVWIDERIKNGKLDCLYVFPDGSGMTIANVKTQEELFDELLSYPMYAFFDWDVTPLVEWKHAFNSVTELYKKMGAK